MENTTLKEKENRAIKALKMFEPHEEPYYLCYSGGKDSDCIRILAILSGVKFEIHHNLTTVDAPETIQYVKSIPDIIIEKSRWSDGSHKTMWNLIPHKMFPPTRLARYCCSELKEHGGKGRLKITGVRASESINRRINGGDIKIIGKPKSTQKFLSENDINFQTTKQNGIVLNFDNAESRRAVEHCFRTTSTMINPILDWSESDVWEFLHYYGCTGNPLYQCGNSRIGCIGCPLSGEKSQKRDFLQYPKYYESYINSFDRMVKALEKRNNKKNLSWTDGESVMKWWLQDKNINPCQMSFEGFDILDL